MMEGEERWIAAAQEGDVGAFNQLVERHQSAAYNVAYRTLRNADDAADATQEAFLSAFRSIRSFRGGSFRAWLLRIVVNACYDVHRYARRRPATSMEAMLEERGDASPHPARTRGWGDPGAPDPEAAALSRETREAIEAAIALLPEDQRVAVVLVDIQGLSYEEAAEAMGSPVGTVRSRLARARARLRDELRARFDEPSMSGGNLP